MCSPAYQYNLTLNSTRVFIALEMNFTFRTEIINNYVNSTGKHFEIANEYTVIILNSPVEWETSKGLFIVMIISTSQFISRQKFFFTETTSCLCVLVLFVTRWRHS